MEWFVKSTAAPFRERTQRFAAVDDNMVMFVPAEAAGEECSADEKQDYVPPTEWVPPHEATNVVNSVLL